MYMPARHAVAEKESVGARPEDSYGRTPVAVPIADNGQITRGAQRYYYVNTDGYGAVAQLECVRAAAWGRSEYPDRRGSVCIPVADHWNIGLPSQGGDDIRRT